MGYQVVQEEPVPNNTLKDVRNSSIGGQLGREDVMEVVVNFTQKYAPVLNIFSALIEIVNGSSTPGNVVDQASLDNGRFKAPMADIMGVAMALSEHRTAAKVISLYLVAGVVAKVVVAMVDHSKVRDYSPHFFSN